MTTGIIFLRVSVKVVDEFKPDTFVFENVPGLLSAKPGGKAVTERIYEAFKEIGFEIRKPELLKKSIYTASELGIPQKKQGNHYWSKEIC